MKIKLEGYDNSSITVNDSTILAWMESVGFSMSLKDFLSEYTYDDTESIQRFVKEKFKPFS